jgi:RHS repeat-associated protein
MRMFKLAQLAAGAGLAALLLCPAQAQTLYFIQADHLNTPRLISDSAGTAVWRWDNQEPFGNDVPNENPSGLGTLVVPLRFPGQYFDKETNLTYNYYRDYDPAIGRYVESDPIGLKGGLNTYLYVYGAPLLYMDESGQLVNWTGRVWGFGVVGALYFFDFTSECKCNKQVHISGFASMLGIFGGVRGPKGGKLPEPNGSGGATKAHSYDDCPDPDAGTGVAAIGGINAVFGIGVNIATKTRFGRLYTDWENPTSGLQIGLDAGIGGALGRSLVTSSQTTEPCCEKK